MSEKWTYRGYDLTILSVVPRLQRLTRTNLGKEHKIWIGRYLQDGPDAYRRTWQRNKGNDAYRLVGLLMAKWLLALKAIHTGEKKSG